jgi:putative lipoic acid-binding regulatory protein
MNQVPASDSLIEYPCDFPIKVMGKNVPQFAQTIADVVRSFDPDFDPATIEMRPSSAKTYMGLTVTVHVTSRAQLDDLYRALSGHEWVKVVM